MLFTNFFVALKGSAISWTSVGSKLMPSYTWLSKEMNLTFSSTASVLSKFGFVAYWDIFSALWLRTLEHLDRDVLFLSDVEMLETKALAVSLNLESMPHVYDAEKERDCRENIHKWQPAFRYSIRKRRLSWKQARIMRFSDDAVQKVLSWLVNSVF